MSERIKEIMEKFRDRGYFRQTKRIPITEVTVQEVLDFATQIGRELSPLFTLDQDNLFAYTNAIKWLLADPTMQAVDIRRETMRAGNLSAGLLIGGTTGTGKSWLLDILSAIALYLSPQVQVYNEAKQRAEKNPLSWVTYRSDELVNLYAKEGDLGRIKSTRVICIQDIGSETQEALYMGNRTNVIAEILEYRADRKELLTLCSTNLSFERLREVYGERVQSRSMEMFNFLPIRGRDRRSWG